MQFEELRFVCQEAATDLAHKHDRPLPPTVVLPGPERTRLLKLPRLPDDDEARHAVLGQLAEDEIMTRAIPCWGFIAEADAGGEDVLLVVFGARRHPPHLTASRFADNGTLEGFVPSEELDPTALPFLHPLQHAVDALPAIGDVFAELDAKRGDPGEPGERGDPSRPS